MIRAAVLGSPIEHSLSPKIHTAAYEFLGVQGTYERFEVRRGELEAFLGAHRDWTGFSLTMPLKEEGISLLGSIESQAKRVGAINTVVLLESGWHGVNTDLFAFSRIFESLNFASVAVIGGGGSARAAIGALDGLVPEINVLIRNQQRKLDLQKVVQESTLQFLPFDYHLSRVDLTISTVPVEAQARVNSDFGGVLFDVLYNPWPTPLAERWDGRIINGFDLVLEQALDQISLFTQNACDYSQLRHFLRGVISL
jgi:shikimate dehydrogenase